MLGILLLVQTEKDFRELYKSHMLLKILLIHLDTNTRKFLQLQTQIYLLSTGPHLENSQLKISKTGKFLLASQIGKTQMVTLFLCTCGFKLMVEVYKMLRLIRGMQLWLMPCILQKALRKKRQSTETYCSKTLN